MNRRAMIKRYSIVAAALVLAACQGQAPAPATTEEPPLAGAPIGGPFTLIDKDGKTVTWDQFRGRYAMVYFGFTFCPDACPTDVAVMTNGLKTFAARDAAAAAKVQPLFISIDPARDTPAKVGEFAANFPGLMGLTGSAAQVDAAAKAFKVFYGRGKDVPGGYLMDHSRIVYLMAPDGKPIAMLPADKGPAAVADELAKWVK